jgi:hypothetical protein
MFYLLLFLATVICPIGYGLLILWGAEYRFRCNTRNLLIAMTAAALLLGTLAVLIQESNK